MNTGEFDWNFANFYSFHFSLLRSFNTSDEKMKKTKEINMYEQIK